jgi:hypothetical protein
MIRCGSLSLLLLLPAVAAAPPRFDAARWSHYAELALPAESEGRHAAHAAVPLDAGAYRHGSPSLADLRVVSAAGEEVRYTLREDAFPQSASELAARMINRVLTPRGELQFVLDFGPLGPLHDSLRFTWSGSDFRRAIRIESSSGLAGWDLVKQAMLLDFRQDGLLYQTRDITYPESGQRYLRVTISDWPDPATLLSVAALRQEGARLKYTELASPQVRASGATPGDGESDSPLQFDLPFRMPAPLRLELAVEGADFVREVEVQSRPEEGRWIPSCHGTIASVAGSASTAIDCPSPLAARVRLVVRNRDNAPVRVTAVRLLAPSKSIFFPLSGPGPYRLYAGNPAAARPAYDLDRVLERSPRAEPAAARLGSWRPNPAYTAPPIPLSERFGGLLIPILAVAVIAIAAAALGLIRQSRSAA